MSLTDFQKLKNLKERGILKWLFDKGLLAPTVFARIESIEIYKKHLAKGLKHSEAIKASAEEQKVNHMTIRRAISDHY